MSVADVASWYVAQSHANCEMLAIRQLSLQGFNTRLPKLRELTTGHISIMFPSYVFLSFDAADRKRWAKINSTRGVKRLLLSTEQEPAALPQGFIDTLHDITEVEPEGFAVGDLVRVSLPGRWEALIGEISRMRRHERCDVLLALFSRTTVVTVDVACLEKVQAS